MKALKNLLLINTLTVVFLIMFYCSNLYPQLVTEFPPPVESVSSLTTPFYGNVFINFDAPVQKIRATLIVDDRVKLLNEINGTTYDCSCGFPLWELIADWTEEDVPAQRSVNLEVLQCQQIEPGICDWVNLPVEFNEDSQTEDKWNIGIDVNYPNTPPNWRYTGYITFTETTPPDCPNGTPCQDPKFRVPSIKVKAVDYNSSFPQNPCADPRKLLAGTIPVVKKDVFLEDYDVEACFNLQSQKWQFLVDNNNTLKPRIVKAVCENNIQFLNIRLADSLDGVDPNYPCEQIVEDIFNYYNYGWWKADRYLFKKLLLEHEQLHVNSYQNEQQRFYESFKQEYQDKLDLFPCEAFESTAEAEDHANSEIRNIIYNWSIVATLSDPIFGFFYHPYTDVTIKELEQNLHVKMYGTITSWWIEAISNCNN